MQVGVFQSLANQEASFRKMISKIWYAVPLIAKIGFVLCALCFLL